MSASTQAVPTSAQPSHALSNILAHPGSSWAGAGVALFTIGSAVQAQQLPTTTLGWVAFLGGLATALGAALGK